MNGTSARLRDAMSIPHRAVCVMALLLTAAERSSQEAGADRDGVVDAERDVVGAECFDFSPGCCRVFGCSSTTFLMCSALATHRDAFNEEYSSECVSVNCKNFVSLVFDPAKGRLPT